MKLTWKGWKEKRKNGRYGVYLHTGQRPLQTCYSSAWERLSSSSWKANFAWSHRMQRNSWPRKQKRAERYCLSRIKIYTFLYNNKGSDRFEQNWRSGYSYSRGARWILASGTQLCKRKLERFKRDEPYDSCQVLSWYGYSSFSFCILNSSSFFFNSSLSSSSR